MSQEVQNRTVKIFIDDQDVQKSLDRSNKLFDKLSEKGKKLEVGTQQWKDNEEAIKKVSKQIELYEGQLSGKFGATLRQLQNEQRKLNRELANMPIELAASSEQAEKLKILEASLMNTHKQAVQNKSSFNGLGNSINQISREMPAFANSFSTGFMAISNNLPIFFDEINRIKEANKALEADGKATKSVFSQVAGSLFSWGTALSVGVTLLTVYGKEIVEFIGQMIKGASSIDATKEAMNAMNEAMQDKAVTEAAKSYLQMENNIKLAKQGLMDKKKVTETYNSTIGRTVGFANNFNEAEDLIIKNRTKYIEAITQRTAANNLMMKAAELTVKKMRLEAGDVGLVDYLLYGAKSLIGGNTAGAMAVVDRQKNEIKNITAQIEELNNAALGLMSKSVENTGKTPEEVKKDQNEKLKKLEQERLANIKKTMEEQYQLTIKFYEDQFKEAEKYWEKEDKAFLERNKKKWDEQNKFYKDEIAAIYDLNISKAESEDELLEAQKQKREAQLQDELSKVQEGSNQAALIWQKYYADVDKLEQDSVTRRVNLINSYVSSISSVAQSINSFLSAQDKAQADSYAFYQRQKRLALTQELAQKTITQEEYNKKIAILEEDAEKAQRKRDYESAKRQKTMAMVEAGLKLAVAWLEYYLNPTRLDKLAGAIAGTAQLAVIAATPLPQFATGTDFAPGGMALVGERGPELVNIPRGSKVLSASQTKSMLNTPEFDFNKIGQASGSISNSVVNNYGGGNDSKEMAMALNKLSDVLSNPQQAYVLFGETEIYNLRKEINRQKNYETENTM